MPDAQPAQSTPTGGPGNLGMPPSAGPIPSPRPQSAEGPPGELPKESEIWTGRTHWKHFLPGIALWIVAASLITWGLFAIRGEDNPGSTVPWIVTILWVGSGVIVLGRIAIHILGNRYRLTTQRLFIEKGILSQTIDQTELMRVDDVRMHKSVLDRMLGLGTIEVMATDSTNPKIIIVGVDAPETVAEHIRANMRIMRKKALFVENL